MLVKVDRSDSRSLDKDCVFLLCFNHHVACSCGVGE